MRCARAGAAATMLIASLPPLMAADHSDHLYLVPDVPADLGAATFLPWEIVRADAGAYSSVLMLPAGTAIDALHRMDNGHWLLSLESPAILGGIPVAGLLAEFAARVLRLFGP